MNNNIIEFKNVNKMFGENIILNNINFEIKEGKFYTLLGPSGSGKTTILKLISGLLDVSSGVIYFNNKKINNIKPEKRLVNTVFQNYALFPNMNVYENIAFGLKIKNKTKDYIDNKVIEMLKLVKLSGFEKRNIDELSGGQQQRIAIARALANEPKILLLDEPLSALDFKLRKEMQYELRSIQQRLGITFIFVTHDQEEALAMSDWIFITNNGKIVQNGTPEDIYDAPINKFVANFIGESNIVKGIMKKDYLVNFLDKDFENIDGGMNINENVEVVIRPEDLDIVDEKEGNIIVTIKDQIFRGDYYEITAYDSSNNKWNVQATNKTIIGERKGLFFDPEDIHIMRLNENEDDFDARLEKYEEDNYNE